jgi:DNA-binding transcriptional regulator YiaG
MGDEFKQQLKAWRSKTNILQKQAADILGVPVRTYQAWETGLHEPGALAKVVINERMTEEAVKKADWNVDPKLNG